MSVLRWLSVVFVVACSGASEPSTSTATTASSPNEAPPETAPAPCLPASGAARLLAEAERIVAAMKESSYSHTTRVDEAAGAFVFDCSGFVDYALARAVPTAFTSLTAATVAHPLAASYVTFVRALASSNEPWRPIAHATDLVPGDIVAWLEPQDVVSTNTGHVMIVGAKGTARAREVLVPVIDSSESGHGSADARTSAHTTGLGRGTIVLLVDEQGTPTGYRWSTEPFSKPHLTQIALAHLD